MSMPETIEVLVKSVTNEADGINSWEFRRLDGAALAPFTAGSHIDLHLANGMVRSYSLCNSQDDQHRYVVAINNDPASRGGSRFVHDQLKAGDRIGIAGPRNHFPLTEDAAHTVLFAGGIGITPIWSMIQRLETLGRSWELYYSTRVSGMCAFKDQLAALEASKPGRVHFNFDHEPGGKVTDLNAIIAGLPRDAHLYCCGPVPMLQAFEAAAHAANWPAHNVHVEYFAPKEEAALEGGFMVELSQSGRNIEIPAGQSILETLLDAGINVPYSCMQGVCGTCEVKVLAGTPDHRDSVLSEEEQAANDIMMVCCSGSKSPKLVLDL